MLLSLLIEIKAINKTQKKASKLAFGLKEGLTLLNGDRVAVAISTSSHDICNSSIIIDRGASYCHSFKPANQPRCNILTCSLR